jgi:hypothetical protein
MLGSFFVISGYQSISTDRGKVLIYAEGCVRRGQLLPELRDIKMTSLSLACLFKIGYECVHQIELRVRKRLESFWRV